MATIDWDDVDLSKPWVRDLLRAELARRERSLTVRAVRLRATSTEGVLEGVASSYGVAYPVGQGVKEVIEQGAFAASLAKRSNVPLFFQHSGFASAPQPPIGTATPIDTRSALTFRAKLF